MSESIGLGKLITTPQQRDAIHIAVAPVVAGCDLAPGQHVGLVDTADLGRVAGNFGGVPTIGIVDPFLDTRLVKKGEKFWLFLYPGSITSLRHDWTHPAFSETATAAPNLDERRAFLAEIALNPTDEMPHRIYADWLEERGEFEEAKKQREWSYVKSEAEQWLRAFAVMYRADYDEMIRVAINGGEYCFGDDDGPQEARGWQFWTNLENLTGKTFADDHREKAYFRCAC